MIDELDLNSKLSKTEINAIDELSDTVYFHSNYGFLNAHKGFRPSNVHMFMGVSHGGKSTLVRSLLIDVLCNSNKRKILLWLSEESKNEFLTEFYKSRFKDFTNDQLLVFSEMDYDNITDSQILPTIEQIVSENNVDILFYDNITTSKIYMDKKISEQSSNAKKIKRLSHDLDIPVIVMAHTGAMITENYNSIISMNDIRGCKSIVNFAQFFYIMQTFHQGEKRFSTIRITKHRGQSIAGAIYKIEYAAKPRIYACSPAISFSQFSEAYKQRNKL